MMTLASSKGTLGFVHEQSIDESSRWNTRVWNLTKPDFKVSTIFFLPDRSSPGREIRLLRLDTTHLVSVKMLKIADSTPARFTVAEPPRNHAMARYAHGKDREGGPARVRLRVGRSGSAILCGEMGTQR